MKSVIIILLILMSGCGNSSDVLFSTSGNILSLNVADLQKKYGCMRNIEIIKSNKSVNYVVLNKDIDEIKCEKSSYEYKISESFDCRKNKYYVNIIFLRTPVGSVFHKEIC